MTGTAVCARFKGLCAIAVLCLAVACNTTGASKAPQTGTGTSGAETAQNTETAGTVQSDNFADPANEPEELVYEADSLTFDIRLSAALRSADRVLFLETPSGVNLNDIPDDLDKWLSRIRDNGGSVKAAPLPPDGKPNRSLLGILIDVILFFVGLAKDEIVFSAVDDFDALMYFDKPTGDVKWVVFTRTR